MIPLSEVLMIGDRAWSPNGEFRADFVHTADNLMPCYVVTTLTGEYLFITRGSSMIDRDLIDAYTQSASPGHWRVEKGGSDLDMWECQTATIERVDAESLVYPSPITGVPNTAVLFKLTGAYQALKQQGVVTAVRHKTNDFIVRVQSPIIVWQKRNSSDRHFLMVDQIKIARMGEFAAEDLYRLGVASGIECLNYVRDTLDWRVGRETVYAIFYVHRLPSELRPPVEFTAVSCPLIHTGGRIEALPPPERVMPRQLELVG